MVLGASMRVVQIQLLQFECPRNELSRYRRSTDSENRKHHRGMKVCPLVKGDLKVNEVVVSAAAMQLTKKPNT